MKLSLLAILTFFSATYVAQISSNLSLDSWANVSSYEEPTNGWATTNPISDAAPGAPVTVTKTTDKYSGTYAAKLTTGKIPFVNTLIGAVLATGFFDNNAAIGQNLKLGTPYTSSPKYFRGYYKYTSVNNDSADIFFALTKWNSTLNRRDTLGQASYREYNTVASYIQFDFKINYTDSITAPDTVIMVFASSGGAQNFQGQSGSTLYVDEISLANTSGVYELFSNEINVEVYPNPTTDYLNINVLEDIKGLTYSIYNSGGKLILNNTLNSKTSINTSQLKEGKYFLSIFDSKGLVASKNFIIIR